MRFTLKAAVFTGLAALMITTVVGPAAPASAWTTSVCALSPDAQTVLRYDGTGSSWTQIGGPAAWLYGGGSGLFATTPDRGQIVHYIAPWWWESIGGPGQTWTVTNDGVYGLAPDASGVWKWTGSPWWWTQVRGPAAWLYGGGAGLFAVTPTRTAISRYQGAPFNWHSLGNPDSPPDPSATYAVTGQELYGLTTSGQVKVWRQFDDGTGRWDLADPFYTYKSIYGGGFGVFGMEGGYLINIVTRLVIATPGSPVAVAGIDIAVTDDDIYAATSNAIWKWTETQSWVKIGTGAKHIVPCP